MSVVSLFCIATDCEEQRAVGLFCITHAKCPAPQRGGWISVYNRKIRKLDTQQRLAANKTTDKPPTDGGDGSPE